MTEILQNVQVFARRRRRRRRRRRQSYDNTSSFSSKTAELKMIKHKPQGFIYQAKLEKIIAELSSSTRTQPYPLSWLS